MTSKNKKNDFENLPGCVTEFVRQLLRKMRSRRKVREDVRAEITAHFEDELRDCRSDEEKEQKARQLVAEFGDLKLLAILLRRAQKRCRPLWRTLVARTFQALGILMLGFIFYAIWFSFGEPTIRVDYIALLNQLNQPQIRNEDNAWPHYEKAIGLYVPQSPLVKQIISHRQKGKDREEAIRLKNSFQENEQRINAWLEKNQKYWNHLAAEQQEVLLKCLEYDWVPFPKMAYQTYTEWQTTTFLRMTEHILRCIKEDTELTMPHPRGSLPRSTPPGFPSAELKRWLENHTIPPNHLEAVSVAVLREAVRRFENFPEDMSAPLTDVECEYIGPWIVQNESAWREFVAGSAKPYCYRPYDPNHHDTPLWNIPLPPLQPFKDLARLGMWRSRLEKEQGRTRQSLEDCIALARSGSHWQGKGTLVEQLVGLAIVGLAHNEILNLAEGQALSAAELKALQDQLSRIYPDGFPLMNMEGERLFFMDIVQRSFTDGGPGGGHLIPGLWDEYTDMSSPGPHVSDEKEKQLFMPLYTALSMVHARRDTTVAKANEIYNLHSKVADMTPYERHVSQLKTVDEIMDESWHHYKFFLIQIFMPATERISEIVYRAKMGHEAAHTILALRRWRLEKGAYPQTLNELISERFLKELPMDPYSNKPLMYRTANDDFILYSIGPNFTDDDGEVAIRRGRPFKWGTPEAGDIMLWPLLKP